MTTLEVLAVSFEGPNAWCQVRCWQGTLSVGDQLSAVRYPDGTGAAVLAAVIQIGTPAGPLTRLEGQGMAHVLLSGQGLGALRPGSLIEGAHHEPHYGTSAPPSPYGPPGAPWPPSQPGPGRQQGTQPPPWPSGPATPPWDQGGHRPPWPYRPPPSPVGYQPAGFGIGLSETDRPDLAVATPDSLSRLTTAFRYILAIPQLIVSYAFGLAAEVVLVLGWFAALFTGRLPAWAAEFLQGYVGYQTRLLGYLLLLTDKYPPFGFEGPAYPIQPLLPPTGRLNRWSVFFRGLLALPAALVAGVVLAGWYVAGVVIWLIVLISSRYPAPLFHATVSVARFGLRVNAYIFLLTSRYPRGLFGDEARPGAPSGGLPRGAKGLLALFLALGIVGWGGYVTALVVTSHHTISRQETLDRVQDDFFAVDLSGLSGQLSGCQSETAPLDCAQPIEATAAHRLEAFRQQIDDLDHPSDTDAEFRTLSRRAEHFATVFRRLSQAPDLRAYFAIVSRDDPSVVGAAFDKAYRTLTSTLSD